MEYRRFAPVAIAGIFVFGGCGKDSNTSVNTSISYEMPQGQIADVAYNMQITPQERYAQLEAARASMGDKAFWNAACSQMPALQQRPASLKALGTAFVISVAQQTVELRQQELTNGKEYNPRDMLDSVALNSMPGALVGTDGNTYVPIKTGEVELRFKQVRTGNFYRIRNGRWERVPSGDTVYTPEGQIAWNDPRYDTVSGTVAERPHDYVSPETAEQSRNETARAETEKKLAEDPFASRAKNAAAHAERIAQDLFRTGKK
ncbi:MAG: hypothetical protein HY513_01160 [Candidatus Aenigmarchaeota archaeon]|nr:hypothetical protein [Candidatus Aenigmarchaeota archaeon]